MIGLDGATWNNLKAWVKGGFLPNFKRICEDGVSGQLYSTIPCVTMPAIPSLVTGKNPGQHGIFDMYTEAGSPIALHNLREPTIWNMLDEYGYSSLIFDLRFTYPPEPLNGVMVCGTPLPAAEQYDYVYPANLRHLLDDYRCTDINRRCEELASKKPYKKRMRS